MGWGSDIREFMRQRGWSYRRLAHEAGVHYQTIQDWVHREDKPCSPTADRFDKWMVETAFAQEYAQTVADKETRDNEWRVGR
jgi:transcriptional regulator with XRE-family HTH domain